MRVFAGGLNSTIPTMVCDLVYSCYGAASAAWSATHQAHRHLVRGISHVRLHFHAIAGRSISARRSASNTGQAG